MCSSYIEILGENEDYVYYVNHNDTPEEHKQNLQKNWGIVCNCTGMLVVCCCVYVLYICVICCLCLWYAYVIANFINR